MAPRLIVNALVGAAQLPHPALPQTSRSTPEPPAAESGPLARPRARACSRMVDGQWDVIPTMGGRPLNAVELQRALARQSKGLGVDSFSGTTAGKYFA